MLSDALMEEIGRGICNFLAQHGIITTIIMGELCDVINIGNVVVVIIIGVIFRIKRKTIIKKSWVIEELLNQFMVLEVQVVSHIKIYEACAL